MSPEIGLLWEIVGELLLTVCQRMVAMGLMGADLHTHSGPVGIQNQ